MYVPGVSTSSIYYIKMDNMQCFSERKNNIALFYLYADFETRLCIKGCDSNYFASILNQLKMKCKRVF